MSAHRRRRFRGNRRGQDEDGKTAKDANIMEAFRIDFLSPVDRPAQEGARALLLKRDSDGRRRQPGKPTVKNDGEDTPGVLTSETDGHTHLVWLHGRVGETTFAVSEGADTSHDHPWVIDLTGMLTIGASEGHTHTVAMQDVTAALITMTKTEGKEPDMPTKTDPKDLTKALEDRLELQSILIGMSDVERTHFGTLETAEKALFVGKSHDERGEDISELAKSKLDDDPIVYKSLDGDTYRKSDDQRNVRSARRADAADKRSRKAESLAKAATYTKRADDELGNLPGTNAERAELLKAIDDIKEDGARTAAMNALKAGNDAMADRFVVRGTQVTPSADANSAEGRLEILVKNHMDANEGVTEAKAFTKVLETPEGSAAYSEINGN